MTGKDQATILASLPSDKAIQYSSPLSGDSVPVIFGEFADISFKRAKQEGGIKGLT
jgi:hypothetical protein